MPELLLIGLVAGLIAGISPCILPVLPVILVAGATGIDATGTDASGAPGRRLRRPLAVVVGLIVSFSVITLAGSELLSVLGLPQDLLRDAGLVVLGLLGAGLLVPQIGHVLERPFARIRVRSPSGGGSGFVLGLGLGAVFVPCAGPVLAAITVVGAQHRVGFTAVSLTIAFSVGAAIPLLLVALAGDQLVHRVRAIANHGRVLRAFGGLVLIAMTLAIALNLTNGLQQSVPGYTHALQNKIEGTSFARQHLSALTGEVAGKLANCTSGAKALQQCGAAPAFTGLAAWLNTPGDKPLTLASLRGKVVLVDFWTYSCINCQRSLPHVEAWYRSYRNDGFVVVGIHTPEFAFEHVVSNVAAAVHQLGVKYPVGVDDNAATWDAYDNEYWPAEYLIDSSGVVRHVEYGEGDYSTSEGVIRSLLVTAHPGLKLPPASDLPNTTPTEPTNPETYLGYERLQYLVGSQVTENAPATYQAPATVPPGGFSFSGTWTVSSEQATAGKSAELILGFQARDIYLVLSGHGTLEVSVNGVRTKTIDIEGVPRLYTLFSSSSLGSGTLVAAVSPGIEAYDFTFG